MPSVKLLVPASGRPATNVPVVEVKSLQVPEFDVDRVPIGPVAVATGAEPTSFPNSSRRSGYQTRPDEVSAATVSVHGRPSPRPPPRAPAQRLPASTVGVESHARYVPGSPAALALVAHIASAFARLPSDPIGVVVDVTNARLAVITSASGLASTTGASPAASSADDEPPPPQPPATTTNQTFHAIAPSVSGDAFNFRNFLTNHHRDDVAIQRASHRERSLTRPAADQSMRVVGLA